MIRRSTFKPAWWLPGPHLQTIWAAIGRPKPPLVLQRERLELADGDFVDLDWTLAPTGPLVIILHGLEGSSNSNYARGLLRAIEARGWRGVVMHFRSCSGESNRLARGYNAGETGDIDFVATLLRQREPDTPIACVGYSLGGNVLLKWLGEQGTDIPLDAAVAVSVPFLLERSAQRLQQGLSRGYQHHLLRSLRDNYRNKFSTWSQPPAAPLETLNDLTTIYHFDDAITAPLHGYADALEYYTHASSRQYLHAIGKPTLILHAKDDPFMFADVAPTEEDLADCVTLELSKRGGHVGFIGGSLPWQPVYWLEQRIPDFLAQHFLN